MRFFPSNLVHTIFSTKTILEPIRWFPAAPWVNSSSIHRQRLGQIAREVRVEAAHHAHVV